MLHPHTAPDTTHELHPNFFNVVQEPSMLDISTLSEFEEEDSLFISSGKVPDSSATVRIGCLPA